MSAGHRHLRAVVPVSRYDDHPDPDGELESMTVTQLLEVRDEAEVHAEQDRSGKARRAIRYIDTLIEKRMGQ